MLDHMTFLLIWILSGLRSNSALLFNATFGYSSNSHKSKVATGHNVNS